MAYRRHTAPRGKAQGRGRRKTRVTRNDAIARRQERGIYAASSADSSSGMKRHKCRAPAEPAAGKPVPAKATRRSSGQKGAQYPSRLVTSSAALTRPKLQFHWSDAISSSEWAIY